MTARDHLRHPLSSRRRRRLAVCLALALAAGAVDASPALGATSATPAVALPAIPAGLPAAIEPMPAYVPQASCDPVPKPGTLALAQLLTATYPDSVALPVASRISRTCALGGPSEHYDGRAFDWNVSVANPQQAAEAAAVVRWLTAPDAAGNPDAMARRLGVMYIIWNKQLMGFWPGGGSWRPYACSGVTACHQDHMHISLTWAGARRVTSYWTGRVAATDYGPCRVPGLAWAPSSTGTANPTPCPALAAPTFPTPPANAPTYLSALRQWSGATFVVGSMGSGVAAVQAAVGATPDGDYGPLTAAAVTAFQRGHGLAATGTMTVDTWRALLAVAGSTTVTTPPAPAPAPVSEPPVAEPPVAPTPVSKPPVTSPPVTSPPVTSPPVTSPPVSKPPAAPPPASSTLWAAPAPTLVPAGPGRALVGYRGTRLHVGSSGSAVRALQRVIGATADGAFGPLTEAALIRFQRAHHLATTGGTDPATWARVVETAAVSPYRTAVLRRGSHGAAVAVLQWEVGAVTDGMFGPHTAVALLAWQRAHHLPATGVTSRAVWSALLG